MHLGDNARLLSAAEKSLATKVFGTTLPPWTQIMLDDGLGIHDAPYTLDLGKLVMIHVGPVCFPDCTSKAEWSGFGRIDAVFIHEMTHVWQYDKGYNVKLSSTWAQTLGSGYFATPGDPWDDYNVEQQARMVENWYARGMSTSADEFPYVDKVVRRGNVNTSKTLPQLKAMS